MKSPPRYELLFALDAQTADALISSASRRTAIGSSGDSICDLYYEPSGNKVRTKTARRRHYRVRRINRAWDVSLESLSWARDTCSLRQTLVPSSDLANLQSDAVDKSWAGRWFHKKVRKNSLVPTLETHFDSATWKHSSPDGEMRLTVESNIQANIVPARHANQAASRPVVAKIVRMSFDVSLPAIFKALIYEFALLPEQPNILLNLARAAARQSVSETRQCSGQIACGANNPGDIRCLEPGFPPASTNEVAICQLG